MIIENLASIQWKAAKTNFLSEEKGEIDLTTIKTVKMNGSSGMQFIGDKFSTGGTDGSKSQLDISADDPKIRDSWVIALNEVLQGSSTIFFTLSVQSVSLSNQYIYPTICHINTYITFNSSI